MIKRFEVDLPRLRVHGASSGPAFGPARSGDPTAVDVRASLEKILGSSGFRNSERMCRFLRVTVERTLAGATDQLKEFSLGHDVFDRGEEIGRASCRERVSPRV